MGLRRVDAPEVAMHENFSFLYNFSYNKLSWNYFNFWNRLLLDGLWTGDKL